MSAKKEKLLYNNEEIRIVMVGKTGAGKSASANTILRKQIFESEFSLKSVTEKCKKADVQVNGQKVSVIDTPGLFDTEIDEETTNKNISQCTSYASPGPHIFLIVIKLGRYTKEEKKTVKKIQKIFGKDADRYSMVLFTHGDLLKGKPFEKFLSDSKEMKELVDKCNGQYHVFDNELEDESQVTELLNKIRNITEKNGGSHYTTEMFQEAERVIEEEKQRIMKAEEEQKKKEQMELEKELERKYEQEIKEAKDKLEKEIEKEYLAELEKEKERQKAEIIKREMEARKKEEEEQRKKEEFKRKCEQEKQEAIDKLEKEHRAKLEKEKERQKAELLKQQQLEARRKAEESPKVVKEIGGFWKFLKTAAVVVTAVATGAAVIVTAPVSVPALAVGAAATGAAGVAGGTTALLVKDL